MNTCTDITSRFANHASTCERPLPWGCAPFADYIIVRAFWAMGDEMQDGPITHVEAVDAEMLADLLPADRWLSCQLAEHAAVITSSSFGDEYFGVAPSKVLAVRINDGGAFAISGQDHERFYSQPTELVEAARYLRATRNNPDAQF